MLDMFKMTSKATVVTMYFNISEFEDANDIVRPKSFYMEKGRATLELDSPMVIFCDDTCYEDIKSIRNVSVSNASDKTTYIIKPMKEYDFYNFSFPVIQKNRIGNEIYIKNRVTASYLIICMFKTVAMFIAKQKNPYGTPFYAWVDFGGSHVMTGFPKYAPKMLANPHPKVSFCIIHYRDAEELSSVKTNFNLGYTGAAGTTFTVETEYMDQFYNGMMSIYHEMLFHKMGHTDEQVLTYFQYRHPELCNIFYGDYYSILMNYHSIRENFWTIKRYVIDEALEKGRHDVARKCIAEVFRSIREGALTIKPSEYKSIETINMRFCDEYGREFNHTLIERTEQLHAEEYIPENAIVLELGARYGTVSCVINKRLSNPLNQVSVEPDSRVWEALEKNRIANECKFHILQGVISKKVVELNTNVNDGYCTQTITSDKSSLKCFTLDEIQNKYNLKFNTLVADCEGFLETFLDENPELYTQLVLILFEKDCPDRCNYNKIKENLSNHGFRCLVFDTHEVWHK